MRRARREQGVAEWTSTSGTKTRATITCCHCNGVSIIPERASPDECGGFCRRCMAPTCKACADKGCTPFERTIEHQEARARMFSAMGL